MSDLTLENILKIGKVTLIKGRYVEILVDKNKNSSNLIYNGEIIKNVSVGSYVKIIKGFEKLIGKIDGEYIKEDRFFDNKEYLQERNKIKRILNISLLGYFEKDNFKRGIKELPLIENECFLLTQDEFKQVHNFIKKIDKRDDEAIKIGNLAIERGKEIEIGVNSLFASHIGIFGNTGSGKSYTLASLYHKLFKKYKNKTGFQKNARFLIIDFNGEYSEDNCITDSEYKKVYKLSTRKDDENKTNNKFFISENEASDIDFWSIFLTATEKTQKPFLARALKNDFYFNNLKIEKDFKFIIKEIIKDLIIKKVDKSDIIQFLKEIQNSIWNKIYLKSLIDDYQENLELHGQSFYHGKENERLYDNKDNFNEKIINTKVEEIKIEIDKITFFEKIRLRIIFQYYNEIAKFNLNSEHIAPLIKRLKKVEDLDLIIEVSNQTSKKTLEIISLLNVSTSMKKILPLLICKQLYDNKKEHYDSSKYLNIIIDEAHNILSHSSKRESETWKDYRLETFEEIIKEGRKFGVFLTIASQRPSDISSTIISQLHNYFLHRLINNRDIEAVEKTISYLDKVSFDTLPILPTGTCVLAGLSTQVPVILEIDEIPDKYEPYNKTIRPTDFWN